MSFLTSKICDGVLWFGLAFFIAFGAVSGEVDHQSGHEDPFSSETILYTKINPAPVRNYAARASLLLHTDPSQA